MFLLFVTQHPTQHLLTNKQFSFNYVTFCEPDKDKQLTAVGNISRLNLR